MKNVKSLTIALPLEAAHCLRADLEKLGWRSDDFDSRAWILRGPEFSLMLLVNSETTKAKLKSIGFDTNPSFKKSEAQLIGEHIELSCDGNGSGWIELQRY